ncbi:superoxide dismutase [Bifidobacterium mongoliense]|uniref:superoxide dismutase n=1 Tax=Bifidobacterium mongoliense TaxID=518643 RepID=UPI002649EE5A|nr:superoxide dismutase [Bifidobacterium mongoliense]MDN6024922.1 superoxide dismutase [Bifidobacterium mongoliense]MDN6051046.1 superoxide dismutase [Bifidobacterium mongoliense]MDN6720368.1 superoxide dismutase [Bifidobacterium mongoliense]
MSTYTLPDLPYDYSALEPYISGRTMQLHHDKHHQVYVTGANTALEQLQEARDRNDFANINRLEKDLAFNLGGHLNHGVFWKNMSPDGGGAPEGELASAIDDAFGSFDKFKAQFNATALGVQGSGWAILAWDHTGGRPVVFQLFDQQGNAPVGVTPLLQLDVWEHAYYLDYQNVRGDYVSAFWNVANWQDAAERFAAATA